MQTERLLKGWEVEWCVNVPVDEESGDADLDRADMRCRDFPSRTKARRFAKRLIYERKDWFGSVRLTPFEMQPFEPGYPGLTREYVGESEFIE